MIKDKAWSLSYVLSGGPVSLSPHKVLSTFCKSGLADTFLKNWIIRAEMEVSRASGVSLGQIGADTD